MILLVLLLSFSPVITGVCPRMLEGIRRDMFYSFQQVVPNAVDTACGRRNFTDAFWSTELNKRLMDYVMRDTKRRNSSLCSQLCIEKMDKEHHAREFELLTYANKYRYEEIMANGEKFLTKDDELRFYASRVIESNGLSVNGEIAYAQTMKRAFGVIETAEMRRYRIATAMKALANTVVGRDHKEIAALIGTLQQLLQNERKFSSITLPLKQKAVWIRPVEILPAIETLYLQYRTLTNYGAKMCIDLTTHVDFGESSIVLDFHQQMNHCRRMGLDLEKASLDSLNKTTVSALETSFPELFDYLLEHGYIAKKNLDIEGSGFQPEQF